jgi:hypothetical protein
VARAESASESADRTSPENRLLRPFLALLSLVLLLCVGIFVVKTWHWPMIGDAALLHYGVFLMEHGMAPYRDIIEINPPGAYLTVAAVMHTLGGGDLSWRIFDLLLLGLAGVAMIVSARPAGWFPGLFAAGIFALVHGQDGIPQLGQRDLVMTVLVLCSYAFLFEALRRDKMSLAIPFGLCMGLAATIKPTALPLAVAVLLLAAIAQWRRGQSIVPLLGLGVASLALPWAGVLLWLQRVRGLGGFLWTLRTLVPYYTTLAHHKLSFLLIHSVSPLLPLIALWLTAIAIARYQTSDISVTASTGTASTGTASFERAALVVGILFGAASYVLQGKGLPYHRYLLLAFLLLTIGIDLTRLLRNKGWVRYVATAGLLLAVLGIAPRSVAKAASYDWRNQEFSAMLAQDLEHLGGQRLSGKVQCLDSVRECLGTLYKLRLVQSTGVLYDLLLFDPKAAPNATSRAGTQRPPQLSPAIQQTRQRFAAALRTQPPEVIIVVSGLFFDNSPSFSKLDAWPQFREFLEPHYDLYVERAPPDPVRWWARAEPTPRYRIYLRKP